MKRGGMYQRDSRATPGCVIALILISAASYIVTIFVIAKAVAKLLT